MNHHLQYCNLTERRRHCCKNLADDVPAVFASMLQLYFCVNRAFTESNLN